MAYLWLAKSSSTTIQALTGHSEHTISDYRRHIMQLVGSSLDDEDTTIGGPEIIVEVDETKLGKRKYNRGHRVKGVWLLVGVERTERTKAFMISIEKRDSDTLITAILHHVKPGSIIHTDMWKGYSLLSQNGFAHRTVNHSQFFVNPESGVHTNTVEGTNHGLKISIAPRNRTADTVDDNLVAFIWRRKHKRDLWNGLLSALRDVGYPEEI